MIDLGQIKTDLQSCITPIHPKRAALEITGQCNSNCVHCYARKLRSMEKMSIADIKSIIDILCDLEFKEVYIVGGEPMIDVQVAHDSCKYAQEKGLKTILVANGLNLSDAEIALSMLKVTDQIEISIRSPDPEVHNRVVSGHFPKDYDFTPDENIPANYKQAVSALKTLSDLKKNDPSLKTTLAVNFDIYQTDPPIDLAYRIVSNLSNLQIKIDAFNLQMASYSGMSQRQPRDIFDINFHISNQQLVLALNDLKKIKNEFNISDVGVTDDPVDHDSTDIKNISEIPEELRDLIVGEKIPAIAPNGQVRNNVIRLDC